MGIPLDRIATKTSFYSFPIPFGACTTKSSSSKVTWKKVSWSQRLLNICKNSKTTLSLGVVEEIFPFTTTKIIYDVTIYGVAFKIMTPLNLKFIKVTHHIKNLQLG